MAIDGQAAVRLGFHRRVAAIEDQVGERSVALVEPLQPRVENTEVQHGPSGKRGVEKGTSLPVGDDLLVVLDRFRNLALVLQQPGLGEHSEHALRVGPQRSLDSRHALHAVAGLLKGEGLGDLVRRRKARRVVSLSRVNFLAGEQVCARQKDRQARGPDSLRHSRSFLAARRQARAVCCSGWYSAYAATDDTRRVPPAERATVYRVFAWNTFRISLAGMAKPTLCREVAKVTMPTTRPFSSNSGPPELPWLTAAVCWT